VQVQIEYEHEYEITASKKLPSYSYSVRPGGRYSYSYSKTARHRPSFAASRAPPPPCNSLATLPPLAPVKRGRGVGGEGESHPQKRPPTRSKSHSDVLGLESPSYKNRQQAIRGRQCPGVRQGCRHSPTLTTMRFPSRLRGFAASRATPPPCNLLTTIPPLAPVKRGRGVGGEGASHPKKRPPTLSKTQRDVLGLESPSYKNRQQAIRVRQCPGVRQGCRHSPRSPPLRLPSRLRGFAASRETRHPATY